MNIAFNLIGVASSISTTYYIITSTGISDHGWELLIAFLSGLIFAILNIGTKILVSLLEKKGIIDKKTAKDIADTVDDLADDGKINHSNDTSNKK